MRSIFVLTLCLFTQPIWSWSKEGHHIICAIARQYMKDQARDSLTHYLGDLSFEEASTWMDEIRGKSSYAYLSTWHYLNLDKDKTYVETETPNVINRLDLVFSNLKNKKGDYQTKQFNLKLLIHLISDLHQPLHVAYAYDRGGNDTKINFIGHETNLHKLWDEIIINSQRIDFEMCIKQAKSLPAFETEVYDQSRFVNWAMDTRSLLPEVYKTGNGLLSSEYLKTSVPILESQLLKAGRRLAGLLNTLYDTQ